MKRVIAVGAAVVLSLAANVANATTDFNKTIVKIGAQGTQAYLYLSPALTIGPAGTCQFDIVYVADTTSAAGKAYYATLLTAYSQGKPLSRVDYVNVGGAGTQCVITLVEIA